MLALRSQLVAGLLLASAPAGAVAPPPSLTEQALVEVWSEPEDDALHDMRLLVDPSGRIHHLVRRMGRDREAFPAAHLVSPGVVLGRAAGRDALLLRCRGCDLARGGQVELRYLHNGLFGTYRTLTLRLERAGDGSFRLADGAGPVRRLRLTSRRWLGVLIGVGAIRVER